MSTTGISATGGPERARNVLFVIENRLIPELGGPIPADPAVARKRLVAFVRRSAVEPEWEMPATTPAVGDAMLSITEATVRCGLSESTIRRALRGERLPGARRDEAGSWRIPERDLAAAGLLKLAPKQEALSRGYVSDTLWVYRSILQWGRVNGWDIPDSSS